jgi:hypothetical protein
LEEPSFSIAYANLCKVMSPIKVEIQQEEGKPPKVTNFRRMLLTKCQQEFEKDKKDDETLEKMRESIEQAASVSCLTMVKLIPGYLAKLMPGYLAKLMPGYVA